MTLLHDPQFPESVRPELFTKYCKLRQEEMCQQVRSMEDGLRFVLLKSGFTQTGLLTTLLEAKRRTGAGGQVGNLNA